MPRRKERPKEPFREPVYRHWVEIKELNTGSVRKLALRPMVRIKIPTKKSSEEAPREEYLELHDDSDVLEARDVPDLAAQLRKRYPDDRHERTLHSERDPVAEEQRARALNSLMDLIVEAAVRELNDEPPAGINSN